MAATAPVLKRREDTMVPQKQYPMLRLDQTLDGGSENSATRSERRRRLSHDEEKEGMYIFQRFWPVTDDQAVSVTWAGKGLIHRPKPATKRRSQPRGPSQRVV
jgi:hypothetical protein